MEKIKKKDKWKRQRKINVSKYNNNYKNMTEELLKYLVERMKMKNSFNSKTKNLDKRPVLEGERWKMYLTAEESIIYVIKKCEAIKGKLRIEEFMGEEGKSVNLMKTIERARKQMIKRNRRN